MEAHIREVFASWDQTTLTVVRGKGLLLGFAIDATKMPIVEGKTPAQVLCSKLMEKGLLTVPAGPEALRILPPLTVTTDEIDDALEIIRSTVQELTLI
jgi:4-aminobutyrate aminotransferase-like enzyme